jgi:lipopolysaccharide export system permease protein
MIYRTYNPVIRQFEDVFWIASIDKIYHMKTLTCEAASPTGKMVDIMVRDASGNLERTASIPTLVLKEMQFDEESLINSITPPRDQSLSMLYSQMRLYGKSMSERAVDIRSNFFYKLAFPLMCLIAVIAPASSCLAFRRSIPQFMIYLLALSGLFCFFLLLQVAFVLAKSQIVEPAVAIVVPWALIFCIFGRNYMRVLGGKL